MFYEDNEFTDLDELMHYGTPRHSGRYPWGSGDNPYQRNASFLKNINDLRKSGMKDKDIAKGMNMSMREMRAKISIAGDQNREYLRREGMRLLDKGYSQSAAARRLGIGPSSFKSLIDPAVTERRNKTRTNADILKKAVDEKGFIDVTAGTEHWLGITQTCLNNAVALAKEEGYSLHKIKIPQMGTSHQTTVNVLAGPDVSWADVMKNRDKIKLVQDVYSEDGGQTMRKVEPPKSIDSSRIYIRYAEDGGAQKEGVIELRRGVDDISLKDAKYAQVRIAVDNTHYMKGMAVHTDNIPDGYDIVFNTNKHVGTPVLGESNDKSIFKLLKKGDDNPFGATIRAFDDQLIRAQRHYIDADGKEQLSALNIVSEEGNWNTWSKSLASQFLAKQNKALIKQQLDMTYSIAKDEYNDISSLTNPVVKATLLNKFADQCDSDAAHLQAAALPRQASKVLLPFTSLKDNEIYAPHLNDGEKVALVRYPHGGIFEIPTLVVNNKNKEARDCIGTSPIDAVGINYHTAERLSGADFDGDTVVVIPFGNGVNIKTHDTLKGLKDFNTKEAYPYHEGMKVMSKREKGKQMGIVSNLITDMTIKGADWDEIERATRHSMVVVDAEKHKLDYKASEIENGIAELRLKYQGKIGGGASTLLSKAKSPVYINERKEKAVYKMTDAEKEAWSKGQLIFEDTGATRKVKTVDKNGNTTWKEETRQQTVSRMEYERDPYKLVSRDASGNTTPQEALYADHANRLLALANQCRKEARSIEDVPRNSSAAEHYKNEVNSLKAKINLAEKEQPLERQAQRIADKNVRTLLMDNPEYRDDRDKVKRLKGNELEKARYLVRNGAKKPPFIVTEKEWEAINAHAVSKTTLLKVMRFADDKRIKELAMPRTPTGMNPAKLARARSYLNSGYTQAEVADMLDISVSTLMKNIQ